MSSTSIVIETKIFYFECECIFQKLNQFHALEQTYKKMKISV